MSVPEYYKHYKKLAQKADINKIVDEFFKKYEKDIIKGWLRDYAFCATVDYNTAQCDEHLVSSDMAREIVQPLYDLVEKLENEIKARLFTLFLTYRPRCANCKYFNSNKCLKHNKIVSSDDLCEQYEPS